MVSGCWSFTLSACRNFLIFPFALSSSQMHFSIRYVLILQLSVLWFVWQWSCSVTICVFSQLSLKLSNLHPSPGLFVIVLEAPRCSTFNPAGFDMYWFHSPFYQASFAWLDQLCFASYFSWSQKFLGDFHTTICSDLPETWEMWAWRSNGHFPNPSLFFPVTAHEDSKPANFPWVHRWWLLWIQLRNF